MFDPGQVAKVSVHGGHSGQFCHHAKDDLEAVVQAYIARGFAWVGITEHMPPPGDAQRYPDESRDGLSADFLQRRFREYFQLCRRLQAKYQDQIQLFTAFETETYPGAMPFIRSLMAETRPDYIVGSVHHVGGIGIDYDQAHYARAAEQAGGLDALYCDYFDAQYEMLQALQPAVVGHLDLIRIFDPDYQARLDQPAIAQRITRNLAFIQAHGLIMDFNLRGFDKAVEAYPSLPVLKQAVGMGVKVVPGDDSHGVSSVGRNYERGVSLLQQLGANLDWPRPKLLPWASSPADGAV